MLKYYFRFFLLVGSVLGFIALIGSLLPRSFDFTSEIEITAPAERVFAEINNLHRWQTWSNWNPSEVEGLIVNCIGEPGVGCAMTWTDSRGNGKLWITESHPNSRMEYRTRFENFPEMASKFELTEQNDNKVMVRWSSRGRLPGGPFYGFWAWSFPGFMQSEYQRALVKLKAQLEET